TADEREIRAAPPGDPEAPRRRRDRRVEAAELDRLRDGFERSRARQRDALVPAVEEALAVDQRDRRLQHRDAPLQRPGRDLVGTAAAFLAPPQPVQVFAR